MCRYGHTKEIWDILKLLLPEFKLPDPPPDEDELEKRKEVGNELPKKQMCNKYVILKVAACFVAVYN